MIADFPFLKIRNSMISLILYHFLYGMQELIYMIKLVPMMGTIFSNKKDIY